MECQELPIPNCYLIKPNIFSDKRGRLVKTWQFSRISQEMGLDLDFKEEYFSVSHQGVLRGLHFQVPPNDCYKLVYCLSGEILDVLVDIRQNSPFYGQSLMLKLNNDNQNIVLMAPGIAHGFYTKSKEATIVCKTTEEYAAEYDKGIHWESVKGWPDNHPIVSDKDSKFPYLEEFNSPFGLMKVLK